MRVAWRPAHGCSKYDSEHEKLRFSCVRLPRNGDKCKQHVIHTVEPETLSCRLCHAGGSCTLRMEWKTHSKHKWAFDSSVECGILNANWVYRMPTMMATAAATAQHYCRYNHCNAFLDCNGCQREGIHFSYLRHSTFVGRNFLHLRKIIIIFQQGASGTRMKQRLAWPMAHKMKWHVFVSITFCCYCCRCCLLLDDVAIIYCRATVIHT